MPEPVGTSTNRSREQQSSDELDLEYGANGAACVDQSRSDAPPARESRQPPASSEPMSEAARGLVNRATRRKLLAAAPATDTNSQRRAASAVTPFSWSVGVTSSGDSALAEAALVKGKKGEAQVELAGGSVQRGLQNEDTVTFAQLQVSSRNGRHSVNAEVGTARAAVGVHNPDGSTGANVSFQRNLFQLEYGYTNGDDSLTLGASVGLGFDASIGLRDADGDGRVETCEKLSAGPITVGTCIEEKPTPAPAGAEGAAGSDPERVSGSGGTSGSGS